MDDGCIWANRFLSIYIYILFKILIHSEKWIQIERLKNVLELQDTIDKQIWYHNPNSEIYPKMIWPWQWVSHKQSLNT